MPGLPPTRSHDNTLEFIFLGTGTSSSLPHVDCLTAPPEREPCRTCLSTLKPEGWKNRRRNTSGVLRMKDKNGEPVTIVIDAGKTFQAAAVEWFPKYGLRKIDALLITHAHADAMNGLDDLRGWTLRGAVQDHVDLYVSQTTFSEVERSFPYLVSKEFASGGGDVPDFKWHIIEDDIPFEIGNTGIVVTPFNVQHGRMFTAPPPVYSDAAPCSNGNGHRINGNHRTNGSSKWEKALLPPPPTNGNTVSNGHSAPNSSGETVTPLYCFGFKFGHQLAYISDVSDIPASAWPHLLPSINQPPLSLLILDCLRPLPHTSHFGLAQAVENARKIGAYRTLLTGFSHEVAHEEWETILPIAEGARPCAEELKEMRKVTRDAIGLMGEGEKAWIRPAFDGLRVWIEGDEVKVDTA